MHIYIKQFAVDQALLFIQLCFILFNHYIILNCFVQWNTRTIFQCHPYIRNIIAQTNILRNSIERLGAAL